MNLKPTRKVGSGMMGGAVAVIAIWAIKQFAGVELPADVASAITLLLTSGPAYLIGEPE